MKWKRVAATFIIVAISLVLTGCCFQHEWEEATCTAPSTCAKCGKTKGEPIEHTWKEATCNDPRTCSVCGTTDGEPKGHDWTNATCEKAKQCNVCGEKEGEALGHDYYSSNKNFACSRCGEEKLFTNADLDDIRREIEVDYATFKKTYWDKEMLISVGWVTHNYSSSFLTWDADQYHFSSSDEEMKSFSGGIVRAKLTGVTKIFGKNTLNFEGTKSSLSEKCP